MMSNETTAEHELDAILEKFRQNPAIEKLVATWMAQKHRSKAKPENMRRSAETYQKASHVRWLGHVKVKTDKQKREERVEL